MWLIYLGVSIVCGFIGLAIGEPKGKGSLGFMLGLILGIIGVIIIAVLPDENRPRPVYLAGQGPVDRPPPFTRDVAGVLVSMADRDMSIAKRPEPKPSLEPERLERHRVPGPKRVESDAGDLETRLRRVEDLRKRGVISPAEADRLRNKVLDEGV